MLSLGVGDVVVYGAHGAGRVEARETRSVDGEQQTVVVIALAAGLSVQLPLTRAQEQLRPIVDEEAIASIQQVLRAPPPPIIGRIAASDGGWPRGWRATLPADS
jgi:RNA polymerase-interacting CarD/CdnL/TRCF family regulator